MDNTSTMQPLIRLYYIIYSLTVRVLLMIAFAPDRVKVVFVTGWDRFCSEAPLLDGPGGLFFLVLPIPPRPGPNPTHSLNGTHFSPPKFCGPVWGMGGVGPWLGVGAVEGEKYTLLPGR